MSMSNGLANDIAYLVNDEDTLYDVRLRGDEWLNDVWFKGFYPTDMNHIFREEIFYKLQNEDNCPIKVHFKMRKSGKRVTIPVSDIWTISK